MTRVKVFVALGMVALAGHWAAGQAPNLEDMDLVLKALPDGPVAIVNGEPVPGEDFAGLYAQEIELLKRRAQRQDIPDEIRLETGLACLRNLIKRELLYQESQRQKIQVGESDLKAQWDVEMQKMKQMSAQAGSAEPTEEQILEMAGTTREVAMAELRKALLVEEVRNSIIEQKQLKVPESDIKTFFNEHQNEFKRPGQIHLNQIYAAYKPTGKPEDEKKRDEARAKMENALKRMQAGETFAGVAKAVSESPDKDRGGDLGSMPAQALPPFYVETAKAMKPGEVSGVIESEFGFHIIKLVEMTEAGEVSLEDATPHIRRMLLGQKAEMAVAEWCDAQLQKQNAVQVFLQLERILEANPQLRTAAEMQGVSASEEAPSGQ